MQGVSLTGFPAEAQPARACDLCFLTGLLALAVEDQE